MATNLWGVARPLGASLAKWRVDTELALPTAMPSCGDGKERLGEPIIVLRLDFRRCEGSCEDLERNRLRRLWTLGVLRKVDLVESRWEVLSALSPSSRSTLPPSAGWLEAGLAVAE